MATPRRDAALDQAAGAVHRLSVLLAGGVPPDAAWGYLDEGAVPPPAAPAEVTSGPRGSADARARTRDSGPHRTDGSRRRWDGSGEPTDGALEPDGPSDAAWRAVRAAWSTAVDTGAPLAPTLARFAASLRDLAQAEREVRIALAGPTATARLVLVLPAVGVLFGAALGFDTVRTLVTPGPGLVCLALGLLLLLVGRAWTRALVRGATPARALPGLDADLTAIAVSAGMPLDRARAIALDRLRTANGSPDPRVDAGLELSRRAGVPAADLLRAEADDARRRHVAETRMRVGRLEVTLMIPLGVCVLPAFLALGVAPLLLSVLGATLTSV